MTAKHKASLHGFLLNTLAVFAFILALSPVCIWCFFHREFEESGARTYAFSLALSIFVFLGLAGFVSCLIPRMFARE
jgi:F0F1-type ATP synthase membrane subunit a